MENQEYNEISLRSLIESVLKNKLLIASITIVIFALVTAYTFFVADEVFESKASIQLRFNEENGSNVTGLLSLYKLNTFDSYMNIVLSQEVLQNVINDLNIEGLDVDSLRSNVIMNNEKDSEFVELKVYDSNENLAMEITNSIIGNSNRQIAIIQKKVLDEDYLETKFRITKNIHLSEGKVSELEELLLTINPSFNLHKSILNDTLATAITDDASTELSHLLGLNIVVEELNEVYVNTLQTLMNEKTTIIGNEETLVSLESSYSFYNDMLVRLIETTELKKFDSLKTNILFISEATKPIHPIAPNKTLNLAIGLMLGLMFGIVVAFFKEYWINSKPA